MAGNLTRTLLQHHIAPKLETIVDRQTKISHEGFAALIEGRLGSDDKPPDMKVWEKGNLGKVCSGSPGYITSIHLYSSPFRLTGNLSNSVIQPLSNPRPPPAMILSSQPSRRLITSPIRAFSWSQSECGTNHIVQVLVEVSWWTLRRCVSFCLLVSY